MLGQNSLESQIAQLETQLAEKKGELLNPENRTTEREMLREVIKSHGGTQESGLNLNSPTPSQASASVSRDVTDEDQKKIDDLVLHSFSHGIASSISMAQSYGDAFLLDKLHDRLVDEYYEKLVQARKIMPE
ncbi:MAG: hypothetical protein COU10_00070 [Candidatus Harrisonbacteria bacterium CG10_big_fil_rev_8_21_14_0_10_45_28]|uniref:Uncharacterized protein n=1 Tax=Candidatus Harrisonbacteria bacterium CG10_big_fil_rev_8_21_14_0_10_45_28 TaxID=1974586 RepID=A0A2H0UPF8_9BACT|nr:MAG: hypothetical protein COU10_00070 [Candidatus Harrisonbacteria bacterium CG10_big_fil_rev_8_21_14_0_10_45_28]